MDEMDDYYHNKISLSPKYIEWTKLPDKSEMFYCKKCYRKPVDEIKLLAHIKRTIVSNDRATQKRKKPKSESLLTVRLRRPKYLSSHSSLDPVRL
jgi:hypothetical protein